MAQAGHPQPRRDNRRGQSLVSYGLACALCFVFAQSTQGQEPVREERRIVVNGGTTLKEIADFLIAAMWQNHRPVIEFDVSLGEMLKAKVR